MKLIVDKLRAFSAVGVVGLARHYCLTRMRSGPATQAWWSRSISAYSAIAVIGWWLYGEPLSMPSSLSVPD